MIIFKLTAFILAILGYYLNGKESTKQTSYYLWIISNSMWIIISLLAGMYIMAGMFTVYIGFILYNIFKEASLMDGINHPVKSEFRIVQSLDKHGETYQIQHRMIFFNFHKTIWKYEKTVNQAYISLRTVEQARNMIQAIKIGKATETDVIEIVA